jgi:Domain of unknown function (DUF305)
MMVAMDVIDVAPDVDVDEDDLGPRGLSWGRALVLAVAVGFLGFAVALVVNRDRPPGPDSVDVGFLQDMLTHHAQALGVATLTIAEGEDPVVRSFAREVLTEQAYETGVMTQKLDDWGYSRQERSDQAMAWMGMAVPVADMPGLLSQEELDQINAARSTPCSWRRWPSTTGAACTWRSTRPSTPATPTSGRSPPVWSATSRARSTSTAWRPGSGGSTSTSRPPRCRPSCRRPDGSLTSALPPLAVTGRR